MKKEFFSSSGLQIIDLSGKMTVEDIKNKYGDDTYEEFEINDDEIVTGEIGNKVKVNMSILQKEEETKKTSKKLESINAIKTKLNLSDEDIENLKQALS